jgi:hypothetical protein
MKTPDPNLRFIRIEFESGVSREEYDRFSEAVMDLAEASMANYPSDCDKEIWVSIEDPEPEPRLPVQPYGSGAFCEACGHFAGRHGAEGCAWPNKPCPCTAMLWLGYRWPRPWLPAPEGLRSS